MAESPFEFPAVRFSSAAFPERQRLARWREEFGRAVLSLDIQPIGHPPYRTDAKLRALPGLRTVDCNGSATRFDLSQTMAAEGDGSIGFVINLGRRAVALQRGHEGAVRPGGAG